MSKPASNAVKPAARLRRFRQKSRLEFARRPKDYRFSHKLGCNFEESTQIHRHVGLTQEMRSRFFEAAHGKTIAGSNIVSATSIPQVAVVPSMT